MSIRNRLERIEKAARTVSAVRPLGEMETAARLSALLVTPSWRQSPNGQRVTEILACAQTRMEAANV